MKLKKVYFEAISNEISIDRHVLVRLKKGDLGFTPARPMKSLGLIERFGVSKAVYTLMATSFLFLSPVYFFYKFLGSLKYQNRDLRDLKGSNLSLVIEANSRAAALVEKTSLNESFYYLNVNQPSTSSLHVYSLLSTIEKMKVYVLSLLITFETAWKLARVTDYLQLYVTYDWLLTYFGLMKARGSFKKVYYSNHYDRWAVLFDNVFTSHTVSLLQHGILPENLELSYKLNRLDEIYVINKRSMGQFTKLYGLGAVKFVMLDMQLQVTEVSCLKPAVLIIGQPHSIPLELEIIDELIELGTYDIFIKPHPLFSASAYGESGRLIKDKNFFPRVDVAVSYESTLGLEYENIGIPVVWIKDKKVEGILQSIRTFIG